MARRREAQVRVGCSGWEYQGWSGRFYPEGLKVGGRFAFYASVFDTVEINNSFYRLPTESAVRSWRERAPPGFLFAVKASRFLTHMKKLKDPAEPLARMFHVLRILGPTLGPVLYQLPPHWRVNTERLAAFLDVLPRDVLHVIEFREPSWYTPEVYALLDRAGVAMCLHDMRGSAAPRMVVGPCVYVRFHGTEERYRGGYPDENLRRWSAWMREHAVQQGKDLFAYFNNDVNCQAPGDALTLRRMLHGQRPARAARYAGVG
ncbi:MAG: DUF72 domain-containing protein [Myxococcota bacterium]